MTDIYAKVEDGVVVSYPIDAASLMNQGANLDLYHLVEYSERPVISSWMYLTEHPVLMSDRVKVMYKAQVMDLRDMLTVCRGRGTQPTVETLGEDFVDRLRTLSIPVLKGKVLDFVRTDPWYDSIESATADLYSNVEPFRTKGEYVMSVMDALKQATNKYFTDILSGDKPLPSSIDDILSLIPPLEWSK
jgi:hypothetical protein